MKKAIVSVIIVLTIVLTVAASASAAGHSVTSFSNGSTGSGPYEGIFYGYVSSENGSRAPIMLKLIHRDEDVQGYLYMGDGLYVDAGICGGANIPTGEQYVRGKTDPKNPKQLLTHLVFNVSDFDVTVDLVSEITDDGEAITAEANIDLPWICGRDPVIRAKLDRIE